MLGHSLWRRTCAQLTLTTSSSPASARSDLAPLTLQPPGKYNNPGYIPMGITGNPKRFLTPPSATFAQHMCDKIRHNSLATKSSSCGRRHTSMSSGLNMSMCPVACQQDRDANTSITTSLAWKWAPSNTLRKCCKTWSDRTLWWTGQKLPLAVLCWVGLRELDCCAGACKEDGAPAGGGCCAGALSRVCGRA